MLNNLMFVITSQYPCTIDFFLKDYIIFFYQKLLLSFEWISDLASIESDIQSGEIVG